MIRMYSEPRDSAWVYVKVICCAVKAANDSFTTNFGDTLYGQVLSNDQFNDSLTHIVTILSGSGPAGGTVTVFDSLVIYVPHVGFCGTDHFRYILTGACGQDTAGVTITVLCDRLPQTDSGQMTTHHMAIHATIRSMYWQMIQFGIGVVR